MKKMNLVLSAMAVAILGCTAAFAYPQMPMHPRLPNVPPQVRVKNNFQGIMAKAPEEIKNAYKEMRTLRKDLRLELCKSEPDADKCIQMVKKSEELHAKVREWQVKQILEGNAPKPDMRRPAPRFHHMGNRGFRRGCGMMMRPVAPRPACPCMNDKASAAPEGVTPVQPAK